MPESSPVNAVNLAEISATITEYGLYRIFHRELFFGATCMLDSRKLSIMTSHEVVLTNKMFVYKD